LLIIIIALRVAIIDGCECAALFNDFKGCQRARSKPAIAFLRLKTTLMDVVCEVEVPYRFSGRFLQGAGLTNFPVQLYVSQWSE
jgi:hypothetical protein